MALPNACPKIPPGQRSLKEQRALKHARREKGVVAMAREVKRGRVSAAETVAKNLVRERDRVCRWPGCDCREMQHGGFWNALEVAHLEHKGMGGDPQQLRTQVQKMILLCRWAHQGPFGLDAGRRDIRPLTDQGTDGECECFKREPGESGRWYSCGITSPPESEG
jgi:hypothetical protein